MGEGPVVAVGWASCCSGLVQLLQWVGSVVAVGWFSCCSGLVQLLQWVGSVVVVGWFSCCSGLVQLLQWVGSVVVGFGSLCCSVSCCVGCPSLSSFSDIIHNFFSFRLCLYVFICYLCG